MMGTAATAGVGVLLVCVVVWEVFQDLLHPGESGALSDWIGRRMFNTLRRWPRLLPFAGSLTVPLVIGTWVVLLTTGFALVYNGWFPLHFQTSTGVTPSSSPRFLSAFYFSFETLITLGYGDLTPLSISMRLIAAVESLIGFGLLTASVTMIVLLYPALARMRLLARTIANVVGTEERTGISPVKTDSDLVLLGLARDVTRARIDLVHFPVIYYFAASDKRAAVPFWIPQLLQWAQDGLEPTRPSHVRLAAGALDAALTDLAAFLRARFLPMESSDRDVTFHAFARDHSIGPGA